MGGKGRRHLLFFAYYYPPLGGAGSLRALSFARHLPELGWDVTVVTPEDGVYGRDPTLPAGDLPGVRVVRTGTWEPGVLLRRWSGKGRGGDGSAEGGAYVEEAALGPLGRAARSLARNFLYFPDPSRGWIRPAVAAAEEVHARRPCDAILSSSPPVSAHVAAHRFQKRAGVPWIADWRDPYSLRLRAEPSRHRRARTLEDGLLGACAALAAATGGLLEHLEDRLPPGRPRALVRNGWDPAPEGFAAAPAPPTGAILHAGTLYGRDQDLAVLLREVAARAAGRGGGGPLLRLLGKVDPYTLGLLEAAGPAGGAEAGGFRGHAEVQAAIREARGLLLLGWTGDPEHGNLIVPAKSYEYLAAGRPILALAAPGTEMERVLGGIPGVTLARFEDGPAIGRWLDAVLGPAPPPGPPPSAAAPFTRRAQAGLLAGLLDAAVAAGVAP